MAKSLLKSLVLMLMLVALGLLLNRVLHSFQIDHVWVDTHIRSHGDYAGIYFLGFAALSMMVGLPRQLSAFFGGYLFGLAGGVVVVSLSALVACVVTFYLGRWVFRPIVRQGLARLSAKLDAFLAEDILLKTIAIRLFPVGNNLLTNIAAGASSAHSVPFFTGSFIGYLPQTCVFVLLGTGVSLHEWWNLYMALALLLVSTLVSYKVYARYRQVAVLD